jgi:hypothetical protein
MRSALIGIICCLLVIPPAQAQQIQQVLVAAQAPGGVVFTTVQFTTQSTGCGGTSSGGVVACAITVTTTTAGILGVICGFGLSGSNVITASNTPTNEATWVRVPNMVQINHLNHGSSNYYSQDCWYSLSLTGGVSTITFNWDRAGFTYRTAASPIFRHSRKRAKTSNMASILQPRRFTRAAILTLNQSTFSRLGHQPPLRS